VCGGDRIRVRDWEEQIRYESRILVLVRAGMKTMAYLLGRDSGALVIARGALGVAWSWSWSWSWSGCARGLVNMSSDNTTYSE
jgi:hypothetical protein